MSLGLDLLTTAQADYIPGASEMFLRYNPFFDLMWKSGKVQKRRLEGPYLEFAVMNDAPSVRQEIRHGNEYMPGGRVQDSVKGNEYAFFFIDYWDVPTKELDLVNGKQDMARIIDAYPKASLGKVYRDFSEQILSGGVTGMSGIVTFNEDQNYVGDGGTRKGIFEFAAISAQTNTAHNISTSTYSGWGNQYDSISSYATDGRQTLREVFWECQEQGEDGSGPEDYVFLADATSYSNHVAEVDDKVQIISTVGTGKGDGSPGTLRKGIMPFADGPMMYRDPGIVLSKFSSGSSNNGVIYLLKPKSFEFIVAGREGRTGMFQLKKPYELPEHPMVRTRIEFFGNLYTRQRRVNGVVTGGAQP